LDDLAFPALFTRAAGELSMAALTNFRIGLFTTAGMLAAALTPASAADYFAGKSIDLLIGAPPAGGYDIYARALARHYGQYIPGKPNIIAKNMPGAASGRAAGFLATIAPKDGTVIAAIMPGAVMGPLLDEKAEVLFDPTKVQYLGTANNGTRVCVSRKESKIKTFADALTQKAVFGGVSANDSTATMATCTSTRRARSTMSLPATAAPTISGLRWSAARSTAPAAGIGRASSRNGRTGCATTR
jgi:tripartite-type tricarboxylate transporter receptor subunit TctC